MALDTVFNMARELEEWTDRGFKDTLASHMQSTKLFEFKYSAPTAAVSISYTEVWRKFHEIETVLRRDFEMLSALALQHPEVDISYLEFPPACSDDSDIRELLRYLRSQSLDEHTKTDLMSELVERLQQQDITVDHVVAVVASEVRNTLAQLLAAASERTPDHRPSQQYDASQITEDIQVICAYVQQQQAASASADEVVGPISRLAQTPVELVGQDSDVLFGAVEHAFKQLRGSKDGELACLHLLLRLCESESGGLTRERAARLQSQLLLVVSPEEDHLVIALVIMLLRLTSGTTDNGCVKLAGMGILQTIEAILRTQPSSAAARAVWSTTVSLACLLICHLETHEQVRAQLDSSTATAVLSAMQRFRDDAQVQASGALALARCFLSVDVRTACGGSAMSALFAAADVHRSEFVVQMATLAALKALTCNVISQSGQAEVQRFCDLGGVRNCTDSLEAFVRHEQGYMLCDVVCDIMSQVGRLKATRPLLSDALPSCAAAILEHGFSTASLRLLRHACDNCDANVTILLQSPVPQALIKGIENNSDLIQPMLQAVGAMARYCESARPQLITLNAHEVIATVAKACESEVVLAEAYHALQYLADIMVAQEAMVRLVVRALLVHVKESLQQPLLRFIHRFCKTSMECKRICGNLGIVEACKHILSQPNTSEKLQIACIYALNEIAEHPSFLQRIAISNAFSTCLSLASKCAATVDGQTIKLNIILLSQKFSGCAEKRSPGLFAKWQNRFWLFEVNALLYFDKKGGECKGEIRYDSIKCAQPCLEGKDDKPHVMEICSRTDRTFFISCQTMEQCAAWIAACNSLRRQAPAAAEK
eukprot:TRINITY_DN5384_c0_g4_i1.p1 TRINITY_DN5384_c0_g4~~TRINITY_DN5384_c0_g4_i1.p1  ORF type:complete len:829 (+),score=179.73 TRINITY_DN5384_c0_g4_i1:197-2683(+)